ncbi:MAG TPA: lipopolysaccharide biosynthesis protein [Stellaceae bacterium]|jgi:PST family polysaccharide transporter|nr:lipopolysaccharide biosynthesis protein [Stellaceae bacterium]
MSASTILRLFAQFLVLPILSRFLGPSEFGLVSIAMPFVLFAQIISDAGIGQSLVRSDGKDRTVWSTMFWVLLALGCGMGVALVAIAPVVADIYHEPRLRPIIMTLALVPVAQACNAVPAAALQRERRFMTLAGAEMTGTICGAVVAVLAAMHGFGAWALIGQQVTLWTGKLVLTFLFTSFRPAFIFIPARIKDHRSFSVNVTSFNVINFFARSLDPLVIGKVLGTAPLGTYTIAYQFMRLPSMIVTGPLQSVLYAQLALMKENKRALRETLLLATRLVSIMVFPAMGLVAAANEPVFSLLLSPRWAAAGWLFMLFAPVGAMQAVTGLNGCVLMATGRTEIQIRLTIEFTVIWVVTLLATVWFGVGWVAALYNISWFLYFPRFSKKFLDTVDCSRRTYLGAMMVPLAMTALGIGVYEAIARSMALPAWMLCVLAFILLLATMAASLLWQKRTLTTEAAALKLWTQPAVPVTPKPEAAPQADLAVDRLPQR